MKRSFLGRIFHYLIHWGYEDSPKPTIIKRWKCSGCGTIMEGPHCRPRPCDWCLTPSWEGKPNPCFYKRFEHPPVWEEITVVGED